MVVVGVVEGFHFVVGVVSWVGGGGTAVVATVASWGFEEVQGMLGEMAVGLDVVVFLKLASSTVVVVVVVVVGTFVVAGEVLK